jgi:hypothetical protein
MKAGHHKDRRVFEGLGNRAMDVGAPVMSSAAFLIAQLVAALGVPTLIGGFAPHRWWWRALLAWLVSPVLVLVAMAVVEVAHDPAKNFDLGQLLFGLALIASVLAIPWAVACLVGFGIGVGLAALLRRRPPAPGPPVEATPPPRPAASPPVAIPAFTSSLEPPSGWHAAHVGLEGDGLLLDGIDIWAANWRAEPGPPVMLPQPAYLHELHRFTVHAVDDGAHATRFAAAELSNGVWVFYRWIVPADAAEAGSADGTLVYTHRFGEAEAGRFDAVAPTATLRVAATGALVFDGAGWFSSRVVPQPDGGLLLVLEQKTRQTIFRIDPIAGSFHDLVEPGPERPLEALAEAAAQALRESLDKANAYTSRFIAPDGSLLVELEAAEWANGHWIQSPCVVAIAGHRILLDLRGTDWDCTVRFPRNGTARLAMSSHLAGIALIADIDVDSGRYTILGRSSEDGEGPVAGFRAVIEREADAARARRSSASPAPASRSPIQTVALVLVMVVVAFVMIGAVAYFAQGRRPTTATKLDRIPDMPRNLPVPERRLP